MAILAFDNQFILLRDDGVIRREKYHSINSGHCCVKGDTVSIFEKMSDKMNSQSDLAYIARYVPDVVFDSAHSLEDRRRFCCVNGASNI